MVDRARAAIGWNALPQTSVRGEQSPQDLAIITWYEILSDAGVPLERYTVCFRSAQQRKRELIAQGREPSILTPYEVAAEWDKVRRMHAELDESRLLTSNAQSLCLRCYGTGMEEMPDGTVRPECEHLPLTDEERKENERQRAHKRDDFIKEAMNVLASKRMPEPPKTEVEFGVELNCTAPGCNHRATTLEGWKIGEQCRARVPGPVRIDERLECQGKMMNW